MLDIQSIIAKLRQDKLWNFRGGLHLPETKSKANQGVISALPLADLFYVPLIQHDGDYEEILVKPGDKVLKGQKLSLGDDLKNVPVHAPTSGYVLEIISHPSMHASGIGIPTIVIKKDGKDESVISDFVNFRDLSRREIIAKIYNHGIAGLGGAGFSSSFKLNALDKCEVVIINAAECETHISCDDLSLQQYADEFLQGLKVLQYALNPQLIVVAIEDDKPKAILRLQKLLFNHENIILKIIPTKFPSGASSQLFQILTGFEIPQGKRMTDLGIVMFNVGTVLAIKHAIIDDKPLIERVVTITGNRVKMPGNYQIRIGTPVDFVLKQVGVMGEDYSVIIGGLMTGFKLHDLKAPVSKIVNCIVLPDVYEFKPRTKDTECIRCSDCATVCPAGLLPQQLYWFAKSQNHEKSKTYNIDACIECGLCDFVCPSNIPLLEYFRQEKFQLSEIARKETKANEARERFEARNLRLEQEKQAREQRLKEATAKRRSELKNNNGEDPVALALARIKEKQATGDQNIEAIKAKRRQRLENQPKNTNE